MSGVPIPNLTLSGQSQSSSDGRNVTSGGSRIVNIGGTGPGVAVYAAAALVGFLLLTRKG